MVALSWIIGLLALIGGLVYLGYLQDKQRTEALRRVAGELKLDFFPKGDAGLVTELAGFHLFSRGDGRKLYNLMRGTTRELDVAVFDYHYSTGSHKSRRDCTQTVACFRFRGGLLPKFRMQPESVFDRLGDWLGFQDIDFASHPDFSNKYVLLGGDERAVRELFTDAVLEGFERQTGLWVEGAGGRMLVYREGQQVKSTDVHELLDDGFGVLEQFFRPPGRA